MDNKIIALSGMPASGKDTVTQKLCALDGGRFVLLKKYRSFDGKSQPKDGYINISVDDFKRKIAAGDFIQYHQRYGRFYGVGKAELGEILDANKIPIVHIGRIENYFVFKNALNLYFSERDKVFQLIHVLLWEKRSELELRIRSREIDLGEQKRKLAAVDQEFRDNKELLERKENPYSYIIQNHNLERTVKAIRDIAAGTDIDVDMGYEEFMRYVLATNNLNLEGVKNSVSTLSIICSKHLVNYCIRNRRFERDLVVDGILNCGPGKEELVFEGCEFQNVKLTEIGCKCIRFVHCTVRGDIRIFKGKVKNVYLRSCPSVSRLYIEESEGQGSGIVLQLTESGVGQLKVIDTKLEKLEFSDVNSSCDEIEFVRDAKVDRINIRCRVGKLKIRELPRIVLSMDGRVNRIHLETVTRRTLRKLEREVFDAGKTGHLTDALMRYKIIVLAAYKHFEKAKMFAESDMCLFEIRRLGVLVRYASTPFWGKGFYLFKRFIFEVCFGWGIQILNNVVTTLCVISLFSAGYFFKGRISQINGPSFLKCVEISVNRFFSVGTDSYVFLPVFDSLESILGIVLLTIITGVLVRKVIR